MKFFLKIFYSFSRSLILFLFRLYFNKEEVRNEDRLELDGPTILVSNHPNTLIDPYNVAARVGNKMCFFLANASMYKTKFGNWFFTNFYCIPIERPKDTNGRPIQNEASFKRSSEFLAGGGNLFIAPQGASKMHRSIGKIKTGTVRIALSAEAANDFKLGLKILPVGLTYESPTNFDRDTFVFVGDAIYPRDYKAAYEKDPYETVRTITEDLRLSMQKLTIDTVDDEEDQLLYNFEALAYAKERPAPSKAFDQTKQFLNNWKSLFENAPSRANDLKESVNNYFDAIASHALKDKMVFGKPANAIFLVFGFIGFLYGYLNNIIPVMLTLFFEKKINVYKGYSSSIKIFLGMFVFGFMYILQTILIHSFFNNWMLTLIYFFSLIPAGLVAWEYKQQFSKWKAKRDFNSLPMKEQDRITGLRAEAVSFCNQEIFKS